MPVVAQVSDLHLSPRVPARQAQAELVLAGINAAKPDLVVVSGDITDDGWDHVDDLRWAMRWLLERISYPQMVLPGNHDVGNFTGAEAGAIDLSRVAYWRDYFRTPAFHDLDHWYIFGIDSMVFGSGLKVETKQSEWLDNGISAADRYGRHAALFLHSPIFLESPYERPNPAASYWMGPPSARKKMWRTIESSVVGLVGSGHVHQTQNTKHDRTAICWAPPASGTWVHAPGLPNPPAPERTGFVLHHLGEDGSVRSEVVECAPMLKTVFYDPLGGAG